MAVTFDIVTLLSLGTLIIDVLLIIFLGVWLYSYFSGSRVELLINFYSLIDRHVLPLLFGISLLASLGPLFFSEVLSYAPCTLCWYQRIFMFPQPFIFGFALLRREVAGIRYALVLSIVGACIALFQYLTQLSLFGSVCDVAGGGVDCATRYILEFGYITIPMMSLTAFLLLIGISLVFLRDRTHFAQDVIDSVDNSVDSFENDSGRGIELSIEERGEFVLA